MNHRVTEGCLVLGALGGPSTFGAQAAREFLKDDARFGKLVFFPNAEDAVEAVRHGDVDAFCAPEQMANTGFHFGIQGWISEPGSVLHVMGEAEHAYHCTLYGKPGANLAGVRKIIGHTGSITQSRRWLQANLPDVEIEIIHTNSMYAGQTVLEADGSIASVGTLALGAELGLQVLAQDIDGGSVGNYWAISRRPYFADQPSRLVVAGRLAAGAELGQLAAALALEGYDWHTTSVAATGQALYEYDYVARFRGEGSLPVVQAVMARYPALRLAGAFDRSVSLARR